MSKKTTFTFFLTFFILLCNDVLAQKPPIKFGKVSMDEMKMTVYDKDTSAAAVVIASYGTSTLQYITTINDFEINFTKHVRIKILKKEGLDEANVSVHLYQSSGGTDEDFSGLKAVTYNLEGDKIVETKLSKKDVFTEQESKNWKIKKFAFLDVKVGSVIEYEYTIQSPYIFNFQSWYFQSDIPVIWSEYRTGIPEYFDYKKVVGGYLSPAISENNAFPATITGTTIRYTNNTNRWVYENVPAFKTEKYITTPKDYLSKIEFELNTFQFPGGMLKTYTTTWKEVVNKLLASDYFGAALNREGIVKELTEQINPSDTPDKKILTAYLLIKKHMKWNGSYKADLDNTLRSAYNKNEGNTAEINLLLVNLLRSVDIEAYPVLISTRSYGKIKTYYPRFSAFNSVVALARVDGKNILMDATSAYLLPGELPYNCLNDKGLVTVKENPYWIDLLSNEQNYTSTMIMAHVENDKLVADIGKSYKNSTAALKRSGIAKDGKEKYIENYKKDNPDWEIAEYTIDNETDVSEMLIEKIRIESFNNIDASADMIYLPALLTIDQEENPFSSETREYPVDFAMPRFEKFMFSLTVPTGYKVEELPQAVKVVLPDKAASFTYNSVVNGKVLQVMAQLKIDKTLFLPQEYHLLRELYRNIIAKYGEQIVLKRIE